MKQSKLNKYSLKYYWDDILFILGNLYYALEYKCKGGAINRGLKRNIELKDIHKGKRSFVVGNGPSIKTQDLTKLRDEITFFVNRSFMHEDYEYIKPDYHIFIDPKLESGQWPISYIDTVLEKNPGVKVLLNSNWYKNEKFSKYRELTNIYWLHQRLFINLYYNPKIKLTRLSIGGAVAEQGVLASIYMGIKNIVILGVDGNGLCYTLTKQKSHFYGINPEDNQMEYKDIYRSLDMMATSLRRWELIVKICKKYNVNIINSTNGGILDICDRIKYENLVN